MQNIPRGDTSNVKDMFTSRFDSVGWLMWACNAEVISMELYQECINNIENGVANGAILEATTQPLRCACVLERQNFGTCSARQHRHALHVTEPATRGHEEVLKCKDDSHPEHKYKTMRTDIKPSFRIPIPATAAGLRSPLVVLLRMHRRSSTQRNPVPGSGGVL